MSWSELEVSGDRNKSYILLINDYLRQEPYKFIRLGQWLGEHCRGIVTKDDIFERVEKRNLLREFQPTWTPIVIRIGSMSDENANALDDLLTDELTIPHCIFAGPMMRRWVNDQATSE